MDLAGCICIHICVYVATIIKEDVMGLRVGVGGGDTGGVRQERRG